MLNRVVLMGRITQDLELKTLSSGVSTLSFTIAVERSYAPQGSERQTDFINCVAWRQKAEFISKYFGKGAMIAIEGSIQTRKYQDKTGVTRTATEVIVDNASFTGEKRDAANTPSRAYEGISAETVGDGVIDDSISDGVPF